MISSGRREALFAVGHLFYQSARLGEIPRSGNINLLVEILSENCLMAQ